MTESATPRILYLSLEALRPGQAAQTHVRIIADGLNAAGLRTRLVAQETADSRAPAAPLLRLASYLTLTVKALLALRNADIAYVRAHPAALAFALGARLLGKPVIHEVNGRTTDLGVTYNLPSWVTAGLNWAQLAQYRWAAALVAVTPGLKAWLDLTLGRRETVALIPNGADGSLFRPDAPGGPKVDGAFALFFGGLVAWHGIDTILAAVRHEAWPARVRLVIAGDGQRGAQVRDAAMDDPRIAALGYLRQEDLAGLAARALAILCPIDSHGARDKGGVAPLKLFEGMAAGRPVIVTDLPFQADLVRNVGCGLVIAPGDAAGLANAVAVMAADPAAADAMGCAGRQAIETDHDWRFRVVETIALIHAVTDRPV